MTRKALLTTVAIALISGTAAILLLISLRNDRSDYGSSGHSVLVPLLIISLLAVAVVVIAGLLDMIVKASSSRVARDAIETVKNVTADVRRPKITSTSGMSTADELTKWVRLRDTGVVSEGEFQTARAELLKEPRH